MKLIAALLLAVAVIQSEASTCVPTVNTVPVPSSIESVVNNVRVYYPSITTIGSAISVIELASPTVSVAESTIEYYEYSYQSLISDMELYDSYPSEYSNLGYISQVTNAYSTLASAISYIESVENTQALLAQYQQTLQSLETSYSSLLTVLSLYTDFASPSIFEASQLISHVTLTDPSIFATVVAISTAVSSSPLASIALNYLSSAVYTLPSSVVTEIETIISSPSTVSSSTISSLESCYSTVYTALSYLTAFTYTFSTLDSELVDYLKAASLVAGIGSAVGSIVSQQMPTLSYELSVMHAAASLESKVTNALAVLTFMEAESPNLYRAESTIEASFYYSPTIAASIYYALDYPSRISNPTVERLEEESHESLVDALVEVISMQKSDTSLGTVFTSIEKVLDSAFQLYGTLLTAYQYLQDVTSPTMAAASASILSAAENVSSLSYILTQLNDVIKAVPNMECAESVVEQFADLYPTIATYIWQVEDGNYYLAQSSFSAFRQEAASYSLFVSEVSFILGYTTEFPSLTSLESSFISAAESDPSLVSQYEEIGSLSS